MTLPVELVALGAATVGESGGRPCHPRLRPVWPGATVAGPVFTVACATGDNLAIHVAVASAPAGAVLVVDASGYPALGYWGEVLTTGAEARDIAGLVIDGGVRDTKALEAHGFPVFSALVALPGAAKVGPGAVNGPVSVGDVAVEPGDWVVADADGVVFISGGDLDQVLVAARARAAREQTMFEQLREGATTLDLLGLDPTAIVRRPP